ncbi:hypothetical protein WOLCODRAFT_133363 [Wolfiporia cocos MD-104 SS10]|uniref:Uncharacterized protein n=1 Tax=Wolfiporia cocos (strain MD-104) TaxID=742152 RepID=A0A2H3K0Q8_WOLCO|nr:hypothetical protein WOLCODRAFT_133363 [Wolfiporia cocos MD-104 SS10]
MSRPNLYRSRAKNSPKLDNVRVGKDIKVDKEGDVEPGSGGISTFAQSSHTWKYPWLLPENAELGDGLGAKNDHGGHWLIIPAAEISLDGYKHLLSELNGRCEKVNRAREVFGELREVDVLPEPANSDKSVRMVYSALQAVHNGNIPIKDWDENDYTYIAILAKALDSGKLSLKDAVTSGPKSTKEQRFIAEAATEFMSAERKISSADEDEMADMDNDHALLKAVLKLDDTESTLYVWV